jgi:hypothetical protein
MQRKRPDPDAWRLFIDGVERVIDDVPELRCRIAAARKRQFAEVHLVRGERPEHNLFALFNADRAVLSYTRDIDVASFSAVSDPEPDGGPFEFLLSNGQQDEYAAGDTIPADDAARAFEHFFQLAELPSWLVWRRDF